MVIFLYPQFFLMAWDVLDISYMRDAWHYDYTQLHKLIGVFNNDTLEKYPRLYLYMSSVIDRSHLLNDGVWSGQLYSTANLLYSSDLRVTRETSLHYMCKHIKFLWENVPSPIIAIIGDMSMFIKERYRGYYNWVDDLPSSFVLQNVLLDLKYKEVYGLFLSLDKKLFSFLETHLSGFLYKKVIEFVEVLAYYLAYIKFSIYIMCGWEKESASVPFVKMTQIKISQFTPQLKKLELEVSTGSVSTLNSGTLFEDLWSCVMGDMPLCIRELPTMQWYRFYEFPITYMLLSLFSFIFKFFFFDAYVFLGFPFHEYTNKYMEATELYRKFPYGITADIGLPASFNRETGLYFQEINDAYSEEYLVSSHDLLDDYSVKNNRSLLVGQDYLNQARFAVSPQLKNHYTSYNWLSKVVSHNIYWVGNRLQFLASASLMSTPWEVLVHSATSAYDRVLHSYLDKSCYGIGTGSSSVVDINYDLYFTTFCCNQLLNAKKGTFVLTSTVRGNHAHFSFEELSDSELLLAVIRYYSEDVVTQSNLRIPNDAFLKEIKKNERLMFNNWGNESFWKYGGTLNEIENYSKIQAIESSIRNEQGNPGGQMSNVLYFYYTVVSKCLYNEKFFSPYYNYPLFFEIPRTFNGECVKENISLNYLLSSGYIADYMTLESFDDTFDESYLYVSRGLGGEYYEDRLAEKRYLADGRELIEVPRVDFGDIRVINRCAKLFEYFYNLPVGESEKESKVRLCVHTGDQYSSTILTGKFYDGFLYYMLKREGNTFVVPIDVWLRNDHVFTDVFLPLYEGKASDINMMKNSEKYFRSLDDSTLLFKILKHATTANLPKEMGELYPLANVFDGFLLEKSVKHCEKYMEYRNNLVEFYKQFEDNSARSYKARYNPLRRTIGYINYGVGLVKDTFMYVPLKVLKIMGYTGTMAGPDPYKALSLRTPIKDMDPITIAQFNVPEWQKEFDFLLNIWDDSHEYYLDYEEEIASGFYDNSSVSLSKYNYENSLDCEYYAENLGRMADPLVDWELESKLSEREEYFMSLVDDPNKLVVTSPLLEECKGDLYKILKEEVESGKGDEQSQKVCFYSMFRESFSKLVNEYMEVRYFGVYHMPLYESMPIYHFFDLGS